MQLLLYTSHTYTITFSRGPDPSLERVILRR